MADYKVVVRQSAINELSGIDTKALRAVIRLIGSLSKSATADAVKFSARNFYHARKGIYRISYFVDDASRKVDVFKVGQREDIFEQ